MKYIEKKYQQLIEDIKSAYEDTERAYEDTCDTLKYHIDELKKIIVEKDEEIKKLKSVSNEGERKRLESLMPEDLVEENKKLKKEIQSLKIKVGQMKSKTEKKAGPKKPAKKKSGTYLVTCQICGKDFVSRGKTAKYCKACKKAKSAEYANKYYHKNKAK